MGRQITKFICQKCGAEYFKWQGQCSQCNEWNSLVETIVSTRNHKSQITNHKSPLIKPIKLSQVKDKTFSRLQTGISELDRVLGGGIVQGSLVLIAGEPGIGKSTLLTQLALRLAARIQHPASSIQQPVGRIQQPESSSQNPAARKKTGNWKQEAGSSILYVCGEESPEQIKIRINRLLASENKYEKNDEPSLSKSKEFTLPARPLAWSQSKGEKQREKLALSLPKGEKYEENLLFLPETNIESILLTINHQSSAIRLIIVDSIQTIWSEKLSGVAGSVGQVKECCNMLLKIAKSTNIPIFLVGHITKEGAIAGPKVLEHLVDTVLYLQGDRQHDFRLLRTSKNRFGPTDEVGVFQMRDTGMEEVLNPTDLFLNSRDAKQTEKAAGRSIVVSMQGVRPMLIEIQALVVPSQLAMPRRVASGIGYRKLQVLCAVIQKRLNLPLANSDVFVNVAGGLNLNEPAADLAIVLAIISSFKNKPLKTHSVCIGELGLLGEIRKVSFMDKRIKEARKLGYKTVIGETERDLRQTLKYLI